MNKNFGKALIFMFLGFLCSVVSVMATESVNIEGITISAPHQPVIPGDKVLVTVNASTSNQAAVYYKFYYCANYGTSDYSFTPWTTTQDYSTTNSCNYSFPNSGNYIIVVRAVTDPQNEPTALPIIGGVVSVGGSTDQVNFSSFSSPTPAIIGTGGSAAISASASTQSGASIYYKFYYCGNYGTSSYDATPWTMLQDYSTSNTCDYSFPSVGNYIVVVRAVINPNNEPTELPIIGGVVRVNQKATSGGTGRLNDTGVNLWATGSTKALTSSQPDFPGQDADYGMDKTNNNDSDGHAGFQFTKIGAQGEILPVIAANWSAILDNVTGLMWENKADDGGLHDKDWTYSWYDPDYTKNGGDDGAMNWGECGGTLSTVDTYHFIEHINNIKFCGYDDWRMPTQEELISIVNFGAYAPAIDSLFFPYTQNGRYWSSSSTVAGSYSWYVNFYYGTNNDEVKGIDHYVRLVRSGL